MSNEAVESFALLVRDMRYAQQQYFHSRSRDDLFIAEYLERKVDRAVSQILEDGK